MAKKKELKVKVVIKQELNPTHIAEYLLRTA